MQEDIPQSSLDTIIGTLNLYKASKIEKSKKEQIKFLQKLIQTRSVNPNVNDPTRSNPYDSIELEVAELIFNKLKKFGLSSKFESVSPYET